MTTPRQTLKRKLLQRELVVGVALDHPASSLAEHLAARGFDLVFIDCEHAGPGFERVPDLVRAVRGAGAASVLRPWSNEPGLVRRFLDCGIDGLVAPQIECAEQARSIRGVMADSDPEDAESLILLPLIETTKGIDNAEHIMQVPGVDGVQVGPGDLAVSLGLPRRGDNAGVREMGLNLFRQATKAGKSSGGPVNRFSVSDMREAGANILMVSANDLLNESAKRLFAGLSKLP
jgi:4-hydroxy-2-oxoheptanedioate aldolase